VTFQETYGFACGSILEGKLSVSLRAVTQKKSEKRNRALRIAKFTVSLNSHWDRCRSQCDWWPSSYTYSQGRVMV